MSGEAELLRRAAALVRARGRVARAQGPYFVKGRCLCQVDAEFESRCLHHLTEWQVRTEVPHDPTIISYQVAQVDDEQDARWIALLSPHVTEPLAEWLEAEAELVPAIETVGEATPKLLDGIAEQQGVEPPPWEMTVHLSTTPSAVAMARALLGEAPS